MATTQRISPTAYATGYFWYRHGLSHPALATARGRRLHIPFSLLMKTLGGKTFETLMLARHRGIDARLTAAIDAGQVSQVIEIAAGLSGRGIRMKQRYGARLTYIETDLPQMAALKRKLLDDAGLLTPQHRVAELDALKDRGPDSLAEIAKSLDSAKGTAIITEGLMNYLDGDTARDVWRRFAKTLSAFPYGLYLSDVYLQRDNRSLAALVFGAVLSSFVKGRIHVHFSSAQNGVDIMRKAGFASAAVLDTADIPETRELARRRGGNRVRILEALT